MLPGHVWRNLGPAARVQKLRKDLSVASKRHREPSYTTLLVNDGLDWPGDREVVSGLDVVRRGGQHRFELAASICSSTVLVVDLQGDPAHAIYFVHRPLAAAADQPSKADLSSVGKGELFRHDGASRPKHVARVATLGSHAPKWHVPQLRAEEHAVQGVERACARVR